VRFTGLKGVNYISVKLCSGVLHTNIRRLGIFRLEIKESRDEKFKAIIIVVSSKKVKGYKKKSSVKKRRKF